MAEEFQSRPQGSMNMHPDMPRPNIPEDVPLDKWSGIDRSDYSTQRFTYSKVSKQDWDAIDWSAHKED